MNTLDSALRHNVNQLGKLLGDTIREALGPQILAQVEAIRQLSKAAQTGDDPQRQMLLATLHQLPNEALLPIARAFSQFLNLTNVAEQYQTISRQQTGANHPELLQKMFARFAAKQLTDKQAIDEAISTLSLELVLTAHPTEITRRTLIHKMIEVNHCLKQLDYNDLTPRERSQIMQRLRELIAQAWHTDEIRACRPSPIDEAKWGFSVVENSLWAGVPAFLRELNHCCVSQVDHPLPIDFVPVKFTSWIGGDRDGNPNVTAQVTRQVMQLGRWQAATLFIRDINTLIMELSMAACNDDIRQLCGNVATPEPYRVILKQLRRRLTHTQRWFEAQLAGDTSVSAADILLESEQLWQPLLAIWQSLHQCGMGTIADGQLLDTLRRVKCFGLPLVRMDIRQESGRHAQAMSEITRYLQIGDFLTWSEADKQAFLIRELCNRRPLLPQHWQPSEETREVLATCQVIATALPGSIATYIISMAKSPADVLTVYLLLQAAGLQEALPVVPLFETLEDLNHAEQVMRQLFAIDWYRQHIQAKQIVMIGYSDSAKDAGVMAAGWAQYRAQDALVKLCHQVGVALTLFHGRGGTIGRGGAPAHAALLSQPPGSLQHGLRVTEQGEMIRFKYGLPEIAVASLALYTSAILEANLLPPPEPEPAWRALMDNLAATSCAVYRNYVCDHPQFIAYFRSATPEKELAKLPLGSRPARRRATDDVASLRAIPWIFAWTQNRLMLPAWLGAGSALQQAIMQGEQQTLETMCRAWPFFATRLHMLEMVYAKADLWVAAYYDQHLVDPHLWPLGEQLRQQLRTDIHTVLAIANDTQLMEYDPWIAESIALRNVYTDPLNVLQVELLSRLRASEQRGDIPDPQVERALMATIAGIAAGMRNTG